MTASTTTQQQQQQAQAQTGSNNNDNSSSITTTTTTATTLSPSHKHKQAFETIASYPVLLNHEESLAKTGYYELKSWWLYLEDIDSLLQDQTAAAAKNKKNNTTTTTTNLEYQRLCGLRDFIGRRSVAALPGSYKLWKHHWEFLLQQRALATATTTANTTTTRVVLQAFETALRTLHTFPRVWMDYLQFVLSLSTRVLELPADGISTAGTVSSSSSGGESQQQQYVLVTKTTFLRQLANRALQALPLAQHEEKIWPVLLECWKDDKELQALDQELGELLGNDNDKNGNGSSHHHHNNNPPDDDDGDESPTEMQLRVETRCRLLRRYCMLQPSFRSTLCEFYREHEKWGEAALLYQQMLHEPNTWDNTPQYFQWWNALADLCTQHPVEVEEAGVPWEAMVRAAVAMANNTTTNNNNHRADDNGMTPTTITTTQSTVLQEMQGLLWSKLADSWIRRGEFDLARSVLEEGLESVSRVRDFTILFDAYLQFEEGLLEAATEQLENGNDDETNDQQDDNDMMTTTTQDDENEAQDDDDDWDILLGTVKLNDDDDDDDDDVDDDGEKRSKPKKASQQSMADLELALARAEHLTSRRPILLNRVLLRQNPNNVGEWVERSRLYAKQGEPIMAASALEEALKTVQASRANNGTPSSLVTELVKLYEGQQSVDKARDFLDRICNQQEYAFRNPDDLAECYAAWVELELRHEAWDDALAIVRSAVAPVRRQPATTSGGGGNNKPLNLTKSLRLWDLLLDLEESLGTVQTAKDAYNRALEIKVATPMHILNFCLFLSEHRYFEESFTAFERGIELFAFPHPGAKLLWKTYIEAFIKRYKGTKVERTRDLFQRCLETCPPEECSEFFMMNGSFEEEYGLTKRALSVYSAMCQKVPAEEKFTAYQLFIAKTTKYLGLTATRDIYQDAIEALQDTPAAQLCQDFAKMETSLQEIDRARAVLTYGAQMADPRRNPEYWKTWNEFEIAHGNEETFREMLRIKRSVEAAFSTVNYNAAEMSAGSKIGNLSNEEAMNMIASREGVEVGNQSKAPIISGFVKSAKRVAEVDNLDEVEERVAKLRKATAGSGVAEALDTNDVANGEDEEIDIDDVDEDDEEEAEGGGNANEGTAPSVVKDVTTKAVPAAVFGGLANAEAGKKQEGDDSSKKGALERLRAAAASGK